MHYDRILLILCYSSKKVMFKNKQDAKEQQLNRCLEEASLESEAQD